MTDEAKEGKASLGGTSSLIVDAQVITAASTSANTLIEQLTNKFSKEITKEAAKVEDSKNDTAAP